YHAKNVHKWDGGKCFFHDLTVCDFGKCKKSDITCQGKPYITKNVLNCPFHSLAYEIACETVIAKSKQTIHKELGCCHTSVIESSHNELLQFRTKNLNLQNFRCFTIMFPLHLGLYKVTCPGCMCTKDQLTIGYLIYLTE
uniref:Uncharacterized protein n=1 Tax=Amphimedon queenslandica TaxID=400682 RepID=A0A1X7SHI3_AMPQE